MTIPTQTFQRALTNLYLDKRPSERIQWEVELDPFLVRLDTEFARRLETYQNVFQEALRRDEFLFQENKDPFRQVGEVVGGTAGFFTGAFVGFFIPTSLAPKIIPLALCTILGQQVGGEVGIVIAKSQKPNLFMAVKYVHQSEVQQAAMAWQQVISQELPNLKRNFKANIITKEEFQRRESQLTAISEHFKEIFARTVQLAADALTGGALFDDQ